MKISVLTPSYNSGQYLKKSIESVISQSYSNWEHIIVDGQSTDETLSILNGYSHLKWISEPDNGQSDAMNKAFAISTGEIIVYLNADDYFYPEAFQTIIDHFTAHPEADIVVGNLHVDRHGQIEESTNATVSWKDLSVIKGRFPLNPVSYMYRRKVQERIGNFPVNEHYTMDYWFLLHAFYFFKPIKIDAFLGCFVFDGNNKTSIIVDGFSVQMPHALKFALRYTPQRFLYVYIKLLIHKRNKTRISRLIKKILNKS
ncbi:glycosyltransferase family 2 protein [uncultured Psychroserpens sp.]|uniref:glycosyltransferase family 2 protein n=1 Tax=uncultured Psychroserpens sp. TaxID=255436 RepID=UPI00260953CB|nr:glycosyltransferase family 2 protein [uncultured Psychroserpens sp.]